MSVHRSSCKVTLILVIFLMKVNFVDRFFEKKKNLNTIFMKILPVGAELFLADGQMDIYNDANSRFAQILRMCLKRMETNNKTYAACSC